MEQEGWVAPHLRCTLKVGEENRLSPSVVLSENMCFIIKCSCLFSLMLHLENYIEIKKNL